MNGCDKKKLEIPFGQKILNYLNVSVVIDFKTERGFG